MLRQISIDRPRLHRFEADVVRQPTPGPWWLWIATVIELPWITGDLLISRVAWGRYRMTDVGIGIAAILLVGIAADHRSLFRPRIREAEAAADLGHEARRVREIEPDERARWADATVRLILDHCDSGADTTTPSVEFVRVGRCGVDVLFEEAIAMTWEGFEATESAWCWRLDPNVELADLEDRVRSSCAVTPQLTVIGEDDDGTYFSRGATELDRHSPDQGVFSSGIVLVSDGDSVIVEPHGLRLTRPSRPPRAQTESIDAIDPLDDHPPTISCDAPDSELPAPRGPVEVRILREIPDLVGVSTSEMTAAAVEFVAYLVTHRYRATLSRLRDSLGASRVGASRSSKTVYTAAGDARRALGPNRVPTATGGQIYVVAEDVTCDWLRFSELRLHGANTSLEIAERRHALVAALEFVQGVPAAASNRFQWLDTEGHLRDICDSVVLAAHELAVLALDGDINPEVGLWAVGKGRILSPDSDTLTADEDRLFAVGQVRA